MKKTQSKYASFGNYKHGMKGTRFYEIWKAMRRRCSSTKPEFYKIYGAKGIYVCKRWAQFINFKEDMYKSYLTHVGAYGETQTSIDRINSKGIYSQKNCRWATREEQANNKSRTVFIEYKGKRQSLAQWSRELGIKYTTILRRYKSKKLTVEALLNPENRSKRQGEVRLQGFLIEK